MPEMQSPQSKTFCSRPWNEINFNNKGFAPCCMIKDTEFASIKEYLDSDWLKSIKSDMLNSNWHPSCESCRYAEEQGAWSNRITYDQIPVDVENPKIEYAHIGFSNTCNLSCQMCKPYLSTTWGNRLYKRTGKKPEIWNTFDNPKTKRDFYKKILPNLKLVGISGGEPFQCKDHFDFLRVAPIINPNLSLFYNSNISNLYYKGEFLPKFFKKFDNVSISASIDGYDDANTYQRMGSNWNDIEKNAIILKDYLSYVHATLTIYTIFSIGDLLRWGLEHDIEIQFYFVSDSSLNPNFLPINKKHELINKLTDEFKNEKTILKGLRKYVFKPLLYEPKNKDKAHREFKEKTIINNRESPILKFPDFVPELKSWYDSILL